MNRYDIVMENIKVTGEMHDRIMAKINETDFGKCKSKILAFADYKRLISIAACFLILIVGTIVIYNMQNVPAVPPVQVDPKLVVHNSVDELSKTVGFEVCEIRTLPFIAEEITYTSFMNQLAEIEYSNQDHTLVFRMAVGSEDISGDYTVYTNITRCIVDNRSVTIKGEDDKYNLAIWESDGFSYSIQSIGGVSEKEMLELVQSVG